MRRELESKILNVNREELVPKILSLGGCLDFEWELTAVWMLCEETSKKVRIRLEWDKVAVEQKIAKENSNSNFKEAEEIGFISNDYEKDKIGYMNVAASDFRSEKFIDMKSHGQHITGYYWSSEDGDKTCSVNFRNGKVYYKKMS